MKNTTQNDLNQELIQSQQSPEQRSTSNSELLSQGESQPTAQSGAASSPKKPPTSERKIKANRQNAKMSTGPKTVAGKNNSRWNSWKFGIYSRKTVIRPENEREIKGLVRELHSELLPETPLQRITFKEIVHCAWQCELAARLDTRTISELVFSADEKETPPDPAEQPTTDWYEAGPAALNQGIAFLERVKADVQEAGYVKEEWRQPLQQNFGPQFLNLLTDETTPIRTEALQLAVCLDYKDQTYNFGGTSNLLRQSTSGPEIMLDPMQRKQNILNIIDERMMHLHSLKKIRRNSPSSIRAEAGNSPPRQFEHATRALHRAIRRYMNLLKEGL